MGRRVTAVLINGAEISRQMQSAEHLLTSVTISFQDTFPDENTRVDDASLESFSTNFVARIRGSDILAQLFDHT